MRVLTALMVTLVVSLLSCGGGGSDTAPPVAPESPDIIPVPQSTVEAPETGILQIGVTDRPDKEVTAVLVSAELIEANVSQEEGAGEWLNLLEGELYFDLIAVTGIEEILGDAEVPAGTYNQIRMHISSVTVTLNGEEVDARVPSGVIKLVQPVEVQAGDITVVTFDFDAEDSVVVTGSQSVIFKPVVKLLVRKASEPFVPETPTPPTPEPEPTLVTEPTPAPEPTLATPVPESTPEPEPTLPTPLPPMIQSTEDGSFFLEITSPQASEVFVETTSVVIAGTTTPDAVVSVNDSFVAVDLEGNFEITVELVEDITLIEVVASIANGDQFGQVITVIYAP